MSKIAVVEELVVRYGSYTAVNGASFHVNQGEIFAIIGPNGSGKTSIVECVEGLRKPASGKVEVFGMDPQRTRAAIYQRMGVQLQEVRFPDKVKVKEICRQFSNFYEHPADWELLLRQLRLEDKQDRFINKLSGGEKQRLSILLALLPQPELLILDELTTGLDPQARRSIWNSLGVIRDMGIGIVLVSHYMEEVQALADRVLLLMGGNVCFCGSLEQLRSYAASQLGEEYNPEWPLDEIYLRLTPEETMWMVEVADHG